MFPVSDRLYCTFKWMQVFGFNLFFFFFFTTGSALWGYMSNVSVDDVGLHFFVFIHENIIFAQCLYVNVNMFLYCLFFHLYVCESVR